MKCVFVKCVKSGNVIVTSGSKGRNRLQQAPGMSETGENCVKQRMLDTFSLSIGSILDMM